jgi:biotin carboxyl carrier protein
MTRRYSVKVGGKERVVDLDGDGEALRIVVDGRPLGAEARALGGGLWAFREGEAQTLAWVDGENAKLMVEVRRPGGDPVVVSTEIADPRAAQAAALGRRAGGSSGAPVIVRSPIPGRVVKLLVRPGDRVTAGQATVVLEAMKMENELRAPRAGTVHEVRCAEGAAVEAGQDLIVVA